jgi:hypothetical protein
MGASRQLDTGASGPQPQLAGSQCVGQCGTRSNLSLMGVACGALMPHCCLTNVAADKHYWDRAPARALLDVLAAELRR